MPNVKCVICGNEFYAKPRHLKVGWGKYCSIDCRSKSQFIGKHLKCDYCGKDIYKRPSDIRKSESRKFFCDRACHCAWENVNRRNLENAPNWNGGETIYRGLMEKSGIEKVCTKCGTDDTRLLVVHHKNANRKNNNIDNLQWLCRNCHYLVHYY